MCNLQALPPRNFSLSQPILCVVRGDPIHIYGGIAIAGVFPTLGDEMRWVVLAIVSVFLGSSASAGVPQVIHPVTGRAIGWDTPTKIPAIFDNGPLGKLSSTQAQTLIEAMMGVWGEVETSDAAFSPAGTLPEDVTSDNVLDYVDGTICTDEFDARIPSMQRGESPILFDNDGRIIDLLAGVGASKKIVGKAALRCYRGSIDNPMAATQAFAIFNGLFIDGQPNPDDLDINIYAGIILHELGHFLGLHHSMVNDGLFQKILLGSASSEDARYIPVMYPLVLRKSPASTMLKPDDIAAISALYPAPAAKLSAVQGTIYQTPTKGFRGANVVARRQDDPLCHAVATISGRFCAPLVDGFNRRSLLGETCVGSAVDKGTFLIEGLTPGLYSVEVSEISSFGGARENMFPKSADITLPASAEFYSEEENSADPIDEKTWLALEGKGVAVHVDIYLNTSKTTSRKSIPLADMARPRESDCGLDPIDYDLLLASLDAAPAQQVAVEETQTDAVPNASGTVGGGCTLRVTPIPHRIGGWLGGGVLLIGAVVFFRSRRRAWYAVIVATALCASTAQAASVLPATPEELVDLAGAAFYGVCETVESQVDARGLHIYEVTYRVERILKGASSSHVVFRVVNSMMAEDGHVEGGVAPFTVGSRDLLFLYPESAWGYTSPVAGAQGRFQVGVDADGHAVVRNPFLEQDMGHAAKGASATPAPDTITPRQLIQQFREIIQRQAP